MIVLAACFGKNVEAALTRGREGGRGWMLVWQSVAVWRGWMAEWQCRSRESVVGGGPNHSHSVADTGHKQTADHTSRSPAESSSKDLPWQSLSLTSQEITIKKQQLKGKKERERKRVIQDDRH